MDGKSYDVFLSYNNDDIRAVEAIARRLEDEAGLRPFLDKWHLVPGEPRQEALENALDSSRTCAVFIGPSGIGPWQNEEMREALNTRVHEADFRTFAVLLPGAITPERGAIPRFLGRLTSVDFRSGIADSDAFNRVVAGIRGASPGRTDGDSSADIKAVCDYLELVEEEAKYVRLFHTPNPIILTDLYVPILVTRERIYRHVIENLWSYTEDEAELSRVYAYRSMGEEEERRYETVPWRVAKGEAKHIIVLADPGMGKTTLLAMEAGITSQQEREKLINSDKSLQDVCIPILLRLVDIAATEGELFDTIPSLLQRNYRRIAERVLPCVEQKLESGHCLLLLDALDEVPQVHRRDLMDKLGRFARLSSCSIIVTSRIVGYEGGFAPDAKEMEIVPFQEEQTGEYVHRWFANATGTLQDASASPEKLLSELQRKPQIRGLTQNPLLLSLLCSLYQERELTLPARRSQVYDKALHFMLERWSRNRRPVSAGRLEAKLKLLEFIAYHFSCSHQEQFSRSELCNQIEHYLQDEFVPSVFRQDDVDTLLTELTEEDGILQSLDPEGRRYLFLHRTFQEYLAASCIHHTSNQDLNEGLDIVQKHLWNYNWHETLSLLAGLMSNPTSLLQVILAEKDDIFGSLLLLTGRCLAECAPRIDDLIFETFDRLMSFWKSSGARFSFSDSTVILLGQTHEAMFDIMRASLYNENSFVRREVAEALGRIGSERAVDDLIHALQDEDRPVRLNAAEALQRIGTEQAIDGINRLQGWEQGHVWATFGTFDKISSEQMLEFLLDDLPEWDRFYVRRNASEALGRIGSEQAVDDLIHTLQDEDHCVRMSAAKALGQFGSERAVDDLIHALQDENRFVRREVAEALGRIGSERAVDDLIHALQDEDHRVRMSAAKALDNVVTSPDTLKKLIQVVGNHIYDFFIFRLARKLSVRFSRENVSFIPVYPELINQKMYR